MPLRLEYSCSTRSSQPWSAICSSVVRVWLLVRLARIAEIWAVVISVRIWFLRATR